MTRLVTLLLAAVFVFTSIAPAFAQSSTAGTVTGVVSNTDTGAPISGAAVSLSGTSSYKTTTDARGSFTISNVAPGVYTLLATANGFVTQRITDYIVLAGSTYTAAVGLQPVTLNSLRTIAQVTSSARGGRGSFNNTAASQTSVGADVFAQQGQSQVMQVLDQLPGFSTAHESANNNPAAPGAASYPNIRGAQTYETASMIDGHAVARVGGGFRSQYLNPALFQNVEIVKGPGASTPSINYAIAGTVNYVTLEPTVKPVTTLRFGIDTWGSQTFSLRSTGSAGRLSYAAVYASNGQNGYLQNFRTAYPLGQWINVGTAGARQSTGAAPTGGFAYVDNNVSPVAPPAPTAANHGLNILNPLTVNQNNYGETGLYACCGSPSTFNNETAQLLKLRYKLSDATSLTYTYMATHGQTDENGNHLWQANTFFNPVLNMNNATAPQISAVQGASYAVPVGGQFMYDDNFLIPQQLRHQDEPINQLDLRTSIGKNITFLGRAFSAVTTNIAGNTVNSPDATTTTYAQVYGSFVPCYGAAGLTGLNAAYGNNYSANCGGSGTNKANPIIFNGQLEPITYGPGPQQSPYCLNPNFNPANPSANGYYMSPTGTGATGINGGKQTGVASSTVLGLACSVGSPGYVGLKQTGISGCNSFTGVPTCAYFASNEKDRILGGTLEFFLTAGPNVYTFSYDSNETKVQQFYYQNMPDIMPVPPGDKQSFISYMERGNFQISPKFNAIVSLYQNRYLFHISLDNGFSFQDTASTHFDGRIGLTYQPSSRMSLRFSAGSSIAPPYIFGILSSGSHIPGAAVLPTFVNQGANSYYTQTEAAPNLQPETSFGYDVGGDFRLFDGSTVLSVDGYMQNIFNQYLIGAGGGGFLNGTADDGTNGTWPLFITGPTNVAKAKMMGVEFSLVRAPARGWGYLLSGALQRSYPYDIPCYVYGLPATTAGCINPSGNLAEIPGINYLVPGGGTGVNTSQGNVTGTARNAIPYSQAYAELSFTSGGGTKYWFGDQYYGNNNTYNRPAFLVASAGLTYPLSGGLREGSIQLAAYNLFNAYPKGYTEQDLGILIPTIVGQNPARPTLAGLTNGLNIGPTRFVIQFTRRIGN